MMLSVADGDAVLRERIAVAGVVIDRATIANRIGFAVGQDGVGCRSQRVKGEIGMEVVEGIERVEVGG